jgi:hypothetical protein
MMSTILELGALAVTVLRVILDLCGMVRRRPFVWCGQHADDSPACRAQPTADRRGMRGRTR